MTNWIDPRDYAATLSDENDLVLLYSGMAPGRYSFLAWGLEEKTESLADFRKKLSGGKWFGFFGYGLGTQFEKLERSRDSYIHLPDLFMMRFKNILVFDHVRQTVTPSNDGVQLFNICSMLNSWTP